MQSSPGTAPDPGELSREELVDELGRARADLASAEDRYLRSRADLENYRKRVGRDLERRVRDEADALLLAWLEVVDSLERALAHEGGSADDAGLRAVLDQVESLLARQGVARLGSVGDAFDPELHEAVAVVPGADRPEGTIADVARPGYAVGDRVIRPAQVAVTRPDGEGADDGD